MPTIEFTQKEIDLWFNDRKYLMNYIEANNFITRHIRKYLWRESLWNYIKTYRGRRILKRALNHLYNSQFN